jgi:hypothetical protein
LDLGGDDLHGPHPVAHLRGDGAEDLAAFLRAFTGIRDDFHRVFRDADDGGFKVCGRE